MSVDISPSEIEWTCKNLENDVYITRTSRSVLRRASKIEGILLDPALARHLRDLQYIVHADRLALANFLGEVQTILSATMKHPSLIDDPLQRRRAAFLLMGGRHLTSTARQFLIEHGIHRIKPDPQKYYLVVGGIYDLATFQTRVTATCESILGLDPSIFLDTIQYTWDPGCPSFTLN